LWNMTSESPLSHGTGLQGLTLSDLRKRVTHNTILSGILQAENGRARTNHRLFRQITNLEDWKETTVRG